MATRSMTTSSVTTRSVATRSMAARSLTTRSVATRSVATRSVTARSRPQRRRVFRLVDTHVATAREADGRDGTPGLLVDRRALDALPLHVGNERFHVVTHEEQLVRAVLVGGMHRELRRWQPENQPAVSGIDGVVLQHVTEKGLIGLGVTAVDDDMGPDDHAPLRSGWCGDPSMPFTSRNP